MFGKTYNGQYATRKYCKACHKIQKDAWYAKNRERIGEKNKVWNEANSEKRKEISKKYTEKYIASGRSKAKAKECREKKPEQYRAYVNFRRKKLRKATPLWADLQAIRNIYQEAQIHKLTVDHIIPLQGEFVSGLHVHNNLQLLPQSENFKKGNKYAVC